MKPRLLHWVALLLVAAMLAPGVARADPHSEAKAHYKKGLSLFALGKFAEAAVEYEAAFELEPDPALLYNAAQAHRLGGNKPRALQLYQSFTRLFPKADDGTVQKHIAALKVAIEAEGKATHAPPVDERAPAERPPEPGVAPATPPPAAPPPAATPANVVVSQGPPPKKKTPAWVWGVVGGGVAVVVGVALGVGLGIGLSSDVYPTPTVGSARVE